MATVDIETRGFDRVSKNISDLGLDLTIEIRENSEDYTRKMQRNILYSVRRNFENTRTDKEGEASLLDAFNGSSVRPHGDVGNWRITTKGSGESHALPLEEGISQHIISGDPWLSFEVDDQSKYPPKYHGEGDKIVTNSVLWRPDKPETATGYNYVEEGQAAWDASIGRQIKQDVRRKIIKNGFK